MPFDILEIQKTIEEKRLVFGQKLEQFLHDKIKFYCSFLLQLGQKFFAKRSAVFITCALIILSSILIRSTRDIGHDSAAYISIAQKILNGGKYYYDFFENNFPLALYLTVIPVFIAKVLAISPIIALEIFVNLGGVLAIYFSALILQNGNSFNGQSLQNRGSIANFIKFKISPKASISQQFVSSYSREQIQIIIICFCAGYFLRIYNLQFNEYGTKSSYFLLLAFPYISYQITNQNSRLAQIISGILAGLIICLKPHYAILPAVFEFSKLRFKDKNFLLPLFSVCNFTTLFVVFFYLLLILKFTPEYFKFLPQFSALYFSKEYINYFTLLKEDIFPLLLLSTVALPYIKKQPILKPLFCASIAAALIIIAEITGGYDQRVIFFSISLALVFAIVFFLLQEKKINWQKDCLLILILLAIPQFDAKSFFSIALNLCYFWWLILFFDKKADRCLFVFAAIAIALLIFDKSGEIYWLFSALMLLVLFKAPISFLAKKNGKDLYLPRSSIISISLILSYFISLFLAAILNHQNLYASNFKSPNYLNESKAFFIQKYAPKNNDEITFIGDAIYDFYPLSIYFNKNNSLPVLHFITLYKNIYESRAIIFNKNLSNKNKALNHIFKSLKAQIAKPDNKLIFIKNKGYWNDECHIKFLEYYFQDVEFKKIFTKNYAFIGEITLAKNEKIVSDLLTHSNDQSLLSEQEMVVDKIEVYQNIKTKYSGGAAIAR